MYCTYRWEQDSLLHKSSLVPSLSAPQIFIAYSMKNRGGKSGHKRHDDACCNVTDKSWPQELGSQAPKFAPNGPKFKNCS